MPADNEHTRRQPDKAAVDLLEGNDVGVLQLPQVLDVRLILFSYFLDGHLLCPEFSQEDSSLGSTTQPLQLRDLLKRHFPSI